VKTGRAMTLADRRPRFEEATNAAREMPPPERTRGPSTAAERDAARAAARALVAHYGSARRACLAAGVSHTALYLLERGEAGTYACACLVAAAAKLPRAA